MSLRLIATACCMAFSGSLLLGCATTPTASSMTPAAAAEALSIENLPQISLPGATRGEVKALAMGAARSKGWMIDSVSEERLVVTRPMSEISLPVGAQGVPWSGGDMEVTSYFVEQPGGLKVATKAELVSPRIGTEPPRRAGYTDDFRDDLAASLESLRTAWTENRGRLARATPPARGWKDPYTGEYTQATPPGTGSTAARASGTPPPSASRVPPASTGQSAYGTPSLASGATPRQPEPATAPGPVPAESRYRRPLPELRPGAPVLDASNALTTTQPPDTTGPQAFPSPAPEASMIALPRRAEPAAGRVSWAASAEQFARERGCQLTAEGSQLIESRRDGEVHKVPCAGSDSVLVKCRDGACQALL